jgi:hypothetical protein
MRSVLIGPAIWDLGPTGLGYCYARRYHLVQQLSLIFKQLVEAVFGHPAKGQCLPFGSDVD